MTTGPVVIVVDADPSVRSSVKFLRPPKTREVAPRWRVEI